MSDRFESYETTLRNCLTESKEALTAKGVSVPEETKLRNVPGLIDGIEVGHAGNAITINCKDEAFIGQTLTARHTDGTTVTKTIDSLTCVIEIPKDGEWTVSNSLTQETFTFNFDTTRDLYEFKQAFIEVTCRPGSYTWDQYFLKPLHVIITNPKSVQLSDTEVMKFDGYKEGGRNDITKTQTVNLRGNYLVEMKWGSIGTPSSKNVNVQNNNQTYKVTFTSTSQSFDTWSDSIGEQPSIGNEPQTQVEEPKWYAVNTTDMTEQQQEEIFNEIDKMIEQKKSDEEINAYISSKEAEYGQI